MKRKRFVRSVVVFAAAAVVLWGVQAFHGASASKLSICFVGYRDSGEKRVAVFRATNSSAQPYAFIGQTPTAPCDFSYRVADRGKWRAMIPDELPRYVAWQTLAPHSSIEFTTPVPNAKNARWDQIPLREVRSYSTPPPIGAGFAVVINFIPGDGPTVQEDLGADRIPFKDKVRIETIRMIRRGYSFIGFHGDPVDQRLGALNDSRGEWVASSLVSVE